MLKNKKNKTDTVIAIFLSLLAVMMPITFTALQPEINLETQEVRQNPTIDAFASILSRIISFFDIIPNVAAQEPPVMGCCEETENGAKCIITTREECQRGWHEGQECGVVCQIGCCIDTQGICSKNAINTDCQLGSFIPNDPNCEQSPLCKKGCCTIGYQKIWTTNLTCFSVYHGVWDGSVPDELTCISQAYEQAMGCCKSYAGCEYITGAECSSKAGTFFSNKKCYDNVPGCEECELLSNEGRCIEGFPDLYGVDSCGNVYSDVRKDDCADNEFCNPETNSCESGNCRNVYDNWNRDTNTFSTLPGYHGKERESGESWCVYDRPDLVFGNGTEPAGSRHWKRYCLYGKEYSEPCADYRQQICSETLFDLTKNDIAKDSSGNPISYLNRYTNNNYRSSASCIGNPWRVCLIINDEEECNENPLCFYISDYAEDVGKSDKYKNWFGIKDEGRISETLGEETIRLPPNCLPKVPPGFDENNRNAFCGFGSIRCTVEDRVFGDTNPECDDREWWELMALRCKAIGDCGAYGNFLHPDQVRYGDPYSNGSIVIAEINPDKDTQGNVIGKEIERTIDLVKDTKYDEILAEQMRKAKDTVEYDKPSVWSTIGAKILVTVGFAGIVVGGLNLFASVIKLINGAEWSFHILKWEIMAGSGAGLKGTWLGLSAAAWVMIAGLLLLGIAALMPPGPGKELVKTTGVGLSAGGFAAMFVSTGTAVAIGVAAALIYALFFAVWDVDEMVVQCMPYMPPAGGDDCEKCNEDPERPCSKYRCESLGTACVWNGTTADGLPCEQSEEEECGICHAEINDGVPPLITKVSVKEADYSVSPPQPGMPPSTIVVSKGGNPIEPNSVFTLQLDFNERAVCKWHTQHTSSFNEMPPAWFGSNTWKYNQTMSIPVGRLIEGYNTVQIYVRCADSYMNANTGEYTIQFTVTTTDLTPPIVLGTDRDYNNKFGYGVTELPLWIYVNEMAKCRWAKQDIDYSLMGGECSSILSQTGFKCNTTLTGLQSEPPGIANYFYIRCNDTSGNVMSQSYVLTLYSTPPLQITSIVPENGAYVKGCEISGVELEVETAGGAEDGKATCYWKNQSMIDFIRFTETNAVSHKTNVSATSQTINITCYDSALNSATNLTSFIVEADQTPPVITRIYKDSGNLVLRTNEDATCSYNFRAHSCNFEANDTLIAKPFSGAGSMEHRVDWTTGPWYVKCYDACGNGWTGPCIVIHPSDFE